MGNGIGTVYGVMRRYMCCWYGELNWYNARSNVKVQVWLFWKMGLVQMWSNENVQVWLLWGIELVQCME